MDQPFAAIADLGYIFGDTPSMMAIPVPKFARDAAGDRPDHRLGWAFWACPPPGGLMVGGWFEVWEEKNGVPEPARQKVAK